MSQPERVSRRLDELATTLIGESLDMLAEGQELGVVASVVDAHDMRLTFASTAEPLGEALSWARDWVMGLAAGTIDREDMGKPVAYALCYLGTVEAEPGGKTPGKKSGQGRAALEPAGLHDALICEFGEAGAGAAWSSYQLVSGMGQGVKFSYSDPLPAGETELLL